MELVETRKARRLLNRHPCLCEAAGEDDAVTPEAIYQIDLKEPYHEKDRQIHLLMKCVACGGYRPQAQSLPFNIGAGLLTETIKLTSRLLMSEQKAIEAVARFVQEDFRFLLDVARFKLRGEKEALRRRLVV